MSDPQPTSVHHVDTQVLGRYLLRRAASESSALLVGFHGYGSNAEIHLENLVEIPGITEWTIASVQALHPFYNRRSGEVVASWMTKLDRERAIEDNCDYVRRVVDQLVSAGELGRPLVYQGFSQGTAMAYRAAASSAHRASGVVAVGGDVPPELAHQDLSGLPRVFLGRGRDDEWYEQAKLENDVALLESKGVTVETHVYDGGHEWTPDLRAAVRDYLDRLSARAAP